MPCVSKTFKAGTAAGGRDLVLSEELLDLLADRIASRVAARLHERPSTSSRRQGTAVPAVPAAVAAEPRIDRLYRVAEASKMLGVCKATVYNLARDGRRTREDWRASQWGDGGEPYRVDRAEAGAVMEAVALLDAGNAKTRG